MGRRGVLVQRSPGLPGVRNSLSIPMLCSVTPSIPTISRRLSMTSRRRRRAFPSYPVTSAGFSMRTGEAALHGSRSAPARDRVSRSSSGAASRRDGSGRCGGATPTGSSGSPRPGLRSRRSWASTASRISAAFATPRK